MSKRTGPPRLPFAHRIRSRLMRVTAVAGITALVATGVAHATSPNQPASTSFADGIAHSTVFTRGEGGYHTFRIPAVVEAQNGDILAFAEARVDNPSDDGDIDLVLKRSFDGGLTWGPIQVLADDGPNKWGNPVPIVTDSGRIVLNTTRTGGNVTGADVRCGNATEEETRRPFILYSDDHGDTWYGLTEITEDVKLSNWGHFVGGPGHGIQLAEGQHAGRLIIPGNHSIFPPPGSGINCLDPSLLGAHAMYSDDDGDTWHLGAVDQPQTTGYHPHESIAVELDDGTIYFSARDQRGDSPGRRVDATSTDGGETFDDTFQPVNGVITSEIQGSLLNLAAISGSRVVFSAPGHPTARENLTLWSSFDDAETWNESLRVYDGPSGYSDLVDLGGDAIGVLFENGERLHDETSLFYSHRISFARVPVTVLDRTPALAPVTVDASGNGHDSPVSGNPRPVPGQSGTGLELAGDYIELPLTTELAFGTSSFTAATWFRTTSQDQQALFWAHSRIDGDPKWWVRVEPNLGRIRALLDDGNVTRSVTAPGNFADGTWHHVALVRDANGVRLYVDGTLAGTASSLSGSVSAGARVGIRVGARVDGINNPLRGAADEVWLFNRALTGSEINTLVQQNAAPSSATVAHLPLDEIMCSGAVQQITPDLSGQGNDGSVIGCGETIGGAFDQATRLSYVDHIEVANDPSVQVGDQPFTAAAWFRSAGETDQAILWAHNWGVTNPQWWIRLEPGQQRIRANLNNGTNVESLEAPGSYNDDQWHHVALTRDASGITLYVDGSAVATSGPISGSLSAGAQHGIHIGQRVDGNSPLSGSVDEVWLFDQALSPTQIAELAQQNAAPNGAARLHLPLDELQES